MPDGAVVDVASRVVARGTAVHRPRRECQVGLGRLEDDTVDRIDPCTVPLPFGDDRVDGLGQTLEVVEPDVSEGDMSGHRLELDLDPGGVAEAPVGVGERVEQIVTGARGDDLPRPSEHVHLQDRLVREPVAKAGRLDAESGDRTPQGDGAQLRDDQRDHSVRQRDVDQALVGAHALHVGRPTVRIDREHALESADVEPGRTSPLAMPEQVGGSLREPHRRAGRDRGVRRPKPTHGVLMLFSSHQAAHTSNVLRIRHVSWRSRQVVTDSMTEASGVATRNVTPVPARSRTAARSSTRAAVASPRTATASRPRAPLDTAIATATCTADRLNESRATVAAAYVRPSVSRTHAPSMAPVRARVDRARVSSFVSVSYTHSDAADD